MATRPRDRVLVRVGVLLAVAGAAGLVGGCARRPAAPVARASYTVGAAYQVGGVWFYPREQFEYAATGLAAVSDRRNGLTADGERADPGAMTAGHPTLQLPSVARVTNLENGRQALVRIDDRGPADPGRVIALSPKAAAVLGAGQGTRVRVELDEAMSHAVAEAVGGGGPRVAIEAAPVAAIRAEALPPPPGVGQSARVRTAPVAAAALTPLPVAGIAVPDSLPDTFLQGPADPGQLYLRASEFGRADYAQRQRGQLAGMAVQVERVHEPRQDRYRVRAGPFATVAQADSALRQALAAGVSDARIVVE